MQMFEREPGITKFDELFNKNAIGPRPHHIPKTQYSIGENQTGFEYLRGNHDQSYLIHVHQTGLSCKTAQELINEIRPGYEVLGLHSCDPTIDEDGNPGSFIILKSKGADWIYDPQ